MFSTFSRYFSRCRNLDLSGGPLFSNALKMILGRILLHTLLLLICATAITPKEIKSNVEETLLDFLNSKHSIPLLGKELIFETSNSSDKPRTLNEYVESGVLHFQSLTSEEKYKVPVSRIFIEKNDVEGRARMKKIILPVLLALTITAAIVLPAVLTVIKLIAVKGLWSGVVSLIISKLLGLKALLHHHHHHDNHFVSEEARRPYLIYVPPGKHRREGQGVNSNEQNSQWEQINVPNLEQWSRTSPRKE